MDLLTFGRDESHFEGAADRVLDVGDDLDVLGIDRAELGDVDRELQPQGANAPSQSRPMPQSRPRAPSTGGQERMQPMSPRTSNQNPFSHLHNS